MPRPALFWQLLAWMENPVPASRVDKLLKCETPTDIDPSVGPVCPNYVRCGAGALWRCPGGVGGGGMAARRLLHTVLV